jgi:hypothetical protein
MRSPPRSAPSDLDPNPGRRMAQGVVDQVSDHLHQEFLVAGERERDVETRDDERLAFVFGGRRKRLGNLARRLRKIERPERRAPRAGLDLADAE